jgi:arabinan endo-1,5-alpha-L-arabinosidase
MASRTTRKRNLRFAWLAALLLSPLAALAVGPGTVTGDTSVHDPSMVKRSDGRYYVYGSHNVTLTSTNRIAFSDAGATFSSIPSWVYTYNSDGDIWAPDVSYRDGKYLMYYTASSFGSNKSAIALASSTTGAPGSWTNQGIVYSSTTSDDYNAIDGNLVVDASNRWWLAFGSYWSGIKLIQIDPSTGKQLASNTSRYNLATRASPGAVEAPFIYRANGWYYLFVSFDACCQGAASTYKIAVGRASQITGPYLDKSGVDMRSGGGSVIHSSQGSMHGPGGQSVINDADGDIIVYHYYDDAGTPRLGINRLGYDSSGWPVVQ